MIISLDAVRTKGIYLRNPRFFRSTRWQRARGRHHKRCRQLASSLVLFIFPRTTTLAPHHERCTSIQAEGIEQFIVFGHLHELIVLVLGDNSTIGQSTELATISLKAFDNLNRRTVGRARLQWLPGWRWGRFALKFSYREFFRGEIEFV